MNCMIELKAGKELSEKETNQNRGSIPRNTFKDPNLEGVISRANSSKQIKESKRLSCFVRFCFTEISLIVLCHGQLGIGGFCLEIRSSTSPRTSYISKNGYSSSFS
ncbi:hypothetical protein O181_109788 [Austropuccinia psidii MF-1]|uniref:Uncharacterized protein n=1 Tax=Austropuccinia psidii MF-1 TaxID=1389203 RepID=A0A9Q3JWM0_9BASI|nr:hypothetical protein [Austropuccinia psidii MF-1]